MSERRVFIRRPQLPLSPVNRDIHKWLPVNQGFYGKYRTWLSNSGCGASTINIYGVAARLVFSMLDKPYWKIDPDADLDPVREYVSLHYSSAGTVEGYRKGFAKFEQYLRLRLDRPKPEKPIPWDQFLNPLIGPDGSTALVDDVKEYYANCRRNWPLERQYEITGDWLSHLTLPLRGMAAIRPNGTAGDITPELWYAYVDTRLADGISARTLNSELSALKAWLQFLAEQEKLICGRMMKVDFLPQGPRVPKDVPVEQLQKLLQAIQTAASSSHAGTRRMGLMDRAWFLLMLHSGLRTGEIRRLKIADIDWERRLLRVEQSKGLKDRLVPFSDTVLDALKAYLAVRGPSEALPENIFIFRHAALTVGYCGQRLSKYYGKKAGIVVTPHQLRHSCATLLLNSGVPILSVQAILGHQHIDTTLEYARLYDGTVAADYFGAMNRLEVIIANQDLSHLSLDHRDLLSLVDSLRKGKLDRKQAKTVLALRERILMAREI